MHISGNFQKLLEPRFRKIFFAAYGELPEQYSKIYNVTSSSKAQEHDYHVSGTGLWDEKLPGQNISEETIDTGDEVTYIHKSYAKMISIERELADDEMYGVMDKLPGKLGKGGRIVVEKTAADVLNNAFTTNGYDGVPLFSTAHPSIKPDASYTHSNLIDPIALDDAGLKQGMLHMRKETRTAENLKMTAQAKKLVVPPDLEYQALTVLQSQQVAGTANNDKNVIQNKVTPVVMDYLTSPTAWFLLDTNLNEMTFFWRVKPEFKGDEIFDNMVAKYRGYLRFSCGYSDWRGWVGSQGQAS